MYGDTSTGWVLITDWLLCVFACFRLAELVAFEDGPLDIFATLRGLTFYSPKGKQRKGTVWTSLQRLVECPFCLGVWFAAALSVLVLWDSGVTFGMGIVFWLAVAGGQYLLEMLVGSTG